MKLARRTKTTKTAVIMNAIDEKLGCRVSREQAIREFAGWLTSEETQELQNALAIFNRIRPEDWE